VTRLGRGGSAHRLMAPYQALASADGYFNLGVANQAMWELFCHAMAFDRLLADDRFATNAERTEHYVALAEEIEQTTRTRTSVEWIELLEQAGVPVGPIYDMAQVFADPPGAGTRDGADGRASGRGSGEAHWHTGEAIGDTGRNSASRPASVSCPGESMDPGCSSTKSECPWIPASAGMTNTMSERTRCIQPPSAHDPRQSP
jgi:hypothetical protein